MATFVVLVLAIGMLVAILFTSRNFAFEQRASANQYNATVAFEAADAGLQWAIAMLNKAAWIGADCTTSSAGGATRFKDRYLRSNPTTDALTVIADDTVIAACVGTQSGPGWSCSCPAPGTAPNPTVPAVTEGGLPGFAIAFRGNPTVGVVEIASYGCVGPITGKNCDGDAAATIIVAVGSISALSTPPASSISVKGDFSVGSAAVTVINSDPASNGITIDAGGFVSATGLKIESVPGTPPWSTVISNDQSLAAITTDEMFTSIFGMPKEQYKILPSITRLQCPCTDDQLASRYALGERQFWLDGTAAEGLTLSNTNNSLGTQADPLIVVVDGPVNLNGGPMLYGFLYSTQPWSGNGSGSATIRGAAVTESNFTSNATPTFFYDPVALARLRIPGASMVPIPGSWRDF